MRSINQVRHFYVATSKGTVTKESAVGTLDVKVSADNSSLSFKYMSPGGMVGSDKIDVDKILYAQHTPAAAMAYNLKNTTVEVVEAIPGKEYAVKVLFTNYAGAGDDNYTVKYGMAVAESDSTEALATALAKSLKANVKDLIPLAKVSDASGSSFSILEVEQDWVVGVKPAVVIPFEVSVFPIDKDGVETTKWANITKTEGSLISNAKKIADMEWFYVGARGDMYRGFGHPHGVKTELVADGKTAYDTLDIHYAYVGPNEGAQKSEKTITIAGSASVIASIKSVLTGKNITVNQTPTKE